MEIIPTEQPTVDEVGSIKTTINKLRILAPLKMKRIDEAVTRRKVLLEVLKRDEVNHGLGVNRFFRMMDYAGEEGEIVYEILGLVLLGHHYNL